MSSAKALQEASNPNQQPPTPSLAKRKRAQERSGIRSPTDNMMSPCSHWLMRKNTKNVTMPSAPVYTLDEKENTPQ